MRKNKSYKELIQLETLEERFDYLSIGGIVGEETFGDSRWVNQQLYTSSFWRSIRQNVIVRDNGCELGIQEFEIPGLIIVHHINTITEDDILERRKCVFDMNNLICASFYVHEAIHYGDRKLLPSYILIERKPGDTTLW